MIRGCRAEKATRDARSPRNSEPEKKGWKAQLVEDLLRRTPEDEVKNSEWPKHPVCKTCTLRQHCSYSVSAVM